ncbi:hypothetical protein ACIOD1_12875 [Streptomyces sp. NPDC088097]|uniref:WDGH domain-containing protein n=1 Tax=Streptomyces sp. NPDC088097 TaxID=3365823 RepID=UPI0037FE5BC4
MPQDMRTQVAAWLTCLGINPNRVPINGDLYIDEGAAGRELHYDEYVFDTNDRPLLDERDSLLTAPKACPLTVEPPEHWQPYRKTTVEEVEAERDGAYRERAQLVAHLASLYPSTIGLTDPDAPDWPVVTINTPTGQMTWHISTIDLDLFEHVERSLGPVWDGHTTDEKYERLRQLTIRPRRGL